MPSSIHKSQVESRRSQVTEEDATLPLHVAMDASAAQISDDLRPSTFDLRPASPTPTPFESGVIRIFVDTAKALALPKSYAEIYGLLYASVRPLSFADIEVRLGLSKGSVSQGLRALKELGAVRSLPADGEGAGAGEESKDQSPRSKVSDSDGSSHDLRPSTFDLGRRTGRAMRGRFEAVLELRQLIAALLRERLAPQLQAGGEGLDGLPALLEQTPLDRTERDILEKRIDKIAKWRRKASGILPLVTKFLG